MPLHNRRIAGAVGFLILSLGAGKIAAQPRVPPPRAQRGGAPNADTPNILIGPFAAPTRDLGVELADETRNRFQDENSAKDLYVTTKINIENALKSSGFPTDSALAATDMMELAKVVHAEYLVQGKSIKAGNALHTEITLYTKTGKEILSQPLTPVDGKDAGDVAKGVERSTSDALKQMPGYRLCIADLRAQKYDQAVKDGSAAVALYQNSTFARICLLQAFDKLNMADSVASVANAILKRDTTSTLALANLLDIASKKGDKAAVATISAKICDLNPLNTDNCRAALDGYVAADSLERAAARLDKMLEPNPADTALLGIKIRLELRQSKWKQAMATGQTLIAADSATANLELLNRLIGAAQKDSNSAKIIEFATKAGQKYPKDISFPLLLAQTQRKAAKLPEASAAIKRAIDLDPKNTDAVVIAINIARDMNQPDSVFAIATRGIAAGADKNILGPVLLGPVATAIKKAQDSKERADWEAAFVAAQAADKNPSPATKFFVGFSSFQIGLDALQNAQKLGADKGKDAKESKVKACAESKVAEDMWATAQVNIVAGAQYNKEGAGNMMGAIQQYNDAIAQMKKAYCTAK